MAIAKFPHAPWVERFSAIIKVVNIISKNKGPESLKYNNTKMFDGRQTAQ